MRPVLSLFFFVLVGMISLDAQQFPGLDKSPHDIASYRVDRQSPVLIRVEYGRPQMKGRTIFGDLVPYGKVWRAGANEATEVTFFEDMTFGGESIKAGTYSLFAIPGETEWTIILNSAINQWGAYRHDEKKDVLKISVPVAASNEAIEAFSISFQEGKMHMGWENTIVSIPVGS